MHFLLQPSKVREYTLSNTKVLASKWLRKLKTYEFDTCKQDNHVKGSISLVVLNLLLRARTTCIIQRRNTLLWLENTTKEFYNLKNSWLISNLKLLVRRKGNVKHIIEFKTLISSESSLLISCRARSTALPQDILLGTWVLLTTEARGTSFWDFTTTDDTYKKKEDILCVKHVHPKSTPRHWRQKKRPIDKDLL